MAEKKIAKKFTIFFSVHQNCKTKKIAISKISKKIFVEKNVSKKKLETNF